MQLMVVKLTGGGAIPKQRKVILTFFSLEGGICTCGEGNGTPLQYSCLENPMDGGAWWAAVHEVAKSWTQLSNFTLTFHFHALEMEMATHSSILEPGVFCERCTEKLPLRVDFIHRLEFGEVSGHREIGRASCRERV